MKKWLSVACMLWAGLASAIPPPPLSFAQDEVFEVDFSVFPISSEMAIGKTESLIRRAPSGVYLTVGGERSFRAASMMPNISYLFQIDVAKEIVRFNLINKELLKAPNKEAYKKLRWESDFLGWKDFIAKAHQQNIKVNLTLSDYEWWQAHIRDLDNIPYSLPEQLNRYQTAPPCNEGNSKFEKKVDLATILNYKSGHYLFYDSYYEAIHKLAVEDRILTLQINLLDRDQIKQLVDYLKAHQLQIGVMDLDNLYYQDYLGSKPYDYLIKSLKPLTKPDSILLVMSNYKDYACGQYQFYLGFRMAHVESWPKGFLMQPFIDSLPIEMNDLIDGKLFEVGDKLP